MKRDGIVTTANLKKFIIAFVGNEPLYKNYLINFETENNTDDLGSIRMRDNKVEFEQTNFNEYLRYSDGLYKGLAPS